jgi:hypothetical protein
MATNMILIAEGPTKIIKLGPQGKFPTKSTLAATSKGFLEIQSNGANNNNKHNTLLAEIKELMKDSPIVTLEGKQPAFARKFASLNLPAKSPGRGQIMQLREKQHVTVRAAYATDIEVSTDAYCEHRIPLNNLQDVIRTQGSWKKHHAIFGRIETVEFGTQKDGLGWVKLTVLVSQTEKIMLKLFNFAKLNEEG